MKYILVPALCGILLASTPALAAPPATQTSAAAPFKGYKLSGKASLTMDEAQTIALQARPGEVTDKELEKEKGGSGLRYSFDIKAQGVTYEVGVDAKTGKVLENGAEGKNPD